MTRFGQRAVVGSTRVVCEATRRANTWNALATWGCLAFGLACMASMPARADVVNLSAIKDTTLYSESNTLSNGSGGHFFAGTNAGGNIRRGLLAFDIAGSIPSGSTVTSVVLTLSMSRTSRGEVFVYLQPCQTDWGEGTSHASGNEGGGASVANNDATWLYSRYLAANPPGSQFWSNPGGDFAPFLSAFASVSGTGTYAWGSTATMVSDVQGWLDNPASNHGWIFIGDEKTPRSSKRFDSKDNPNASVRPVLVVNYSPPASSGACCQTNGICEVLSMIDCTSQSGSYHGDGTSCTPNPCPQPTGACCYGDLSCQITTAADCSTSGVYQGDGTPCKPDPCEPITGACCFSDGSCEQQAADDCDALGGTYQGDATVCTNGLCPVVLTPFLDPLPIPPFATPTVGTIGLEATYDIEIVQVKQQLHQDLPPTTVWAYDGIYPGPTILATRDHPVTVNWINNLMNSNGTARTDHYLDVDLCPHGSEDVAKTVVHLHGGHVPSNVDGYPEDAYLPGAMLTYEYPNNQLPGLIWYHDHALGITRLNVYMGLAGAYVITDAFEQSLGLPAGEFDVPLILQDRKFNPDGSLQYPSAWQEHFFGDTMLVNGMVMPYMDVKQGKYRFRVLNGSNSRTLTLSLSNGQSFHQVGTDGGLVPAPVKLTEVTLGPAERADLVIDFLGSPPGTEIVLTNSAPAPFPGTPGVGVIPNVMKFVVGATVGFTDSIPTSLRPLDALDPSDAVVEREFVLQKTPDPCTGSSWKINGLHWNNITEFPRLGTTEIWTFINRSGISHPMHVHLDFFQVMYTQGFTVMGENITTNGPRILPAPNQAGWKDTVMVPPNQLVKVVTRFNDYPGLFPYHCHILEHEDHDMMRQFRAVVFGDADVDGDVDLGDFAVMVDCLFGPDVVPNPPAPPPTTADCLEAFDADQDGDVDLEDYATMQNNFTG